VGHAIKVLLPQEIPGLVVSATPEAVDLEQIDFYLERRYLLPLMERQQGMCFYCMRALVADSAVLDHLVPQVAGGTNSYRNIVVACHECNARKQALEAEEFLRMLYRDGILGQADLMGRREILSHVISGNLVPSVGAAEQGVAPDGRPQTAARR
ncbi:MAG: HNH endonuclease, partial [Syntrophales bacterium]|nr:HNH endonuclease [Syntrophales bacterium]